MNNNVDLPKMNNDKINNNIKANNIDENKDVKKEVSNNKNDGFKEMFKYVTTKDSKSLLLLFVRLIIIVAIISIFKFPFDLLKEAGTSLLILFGITITETILNIWDSVINIIYYILAIYAFYKIIKVRFNNINSK